jgi:hypothetical protein
MMVYIDEFERMRRTRRSEQRRGLDISEKSASTQSKNRWTKKKAATGCPGPLSGKNAVDYLLVPSNAGLSELSTGLSPSQMRRIAL